MMSTEEVSAAAALLNHHGLAGGEAGSAVEQDVGNWLQRMTAEYDELRTTNATLAARVRELERMTGGVGAFNDEELLAELPTRMSRALRSAQHVAQEIVQQARDRETALLQKAAEEAAGISQRAHADAQALRQQASDEARAHLEKARRRCEEIASQAKAQRERMVAELEARSAALDEESERLETGRTYLRQVFATLKEALEEPARAGFAEEALVAPPETSSFTAPAQARSRHPRNGSRGARHYELRPHDEVLSTPPDPATDPPPRTSPPRPVKVLFVCDSNLCSSPMAALLLGRRLSGLGVRAAVRSAGLEQRGARPPAPVQQVLRARGLELQGYLGEVLNARLLGEADLVLGMGFRHIQAAAHFAPRAWPYTFTLKELVSFDSIVSARREDEPLEGLLSRVHRARTELGGSAQDSRPGGPGDDVPDEIAYSLDACEREAQELERLIDRLVAFLWRGPVPPTSPFRKIFDDAS